MGTETIKTCDVFGRRQDVENYGISIVDEEGNVVLDVTADLSPKALKRAKALVQKAVTSAKRKAKAAS